VVWFGAYERAVTLPSPTRFQRCGFGSKNKWTPIADELHISTGTVQQVLKRRKALITPPVTS
jgi:hypothetical protein